MSTTLHPVGVMDGCDIYKIGREAIITLQPSTGYIAVACPWHAELNGCHWWAHRGDQSLVDFLLDLDCNYVVGKLFNCEQVEEFDRAQTIINLKRWIIEQRRSESLTTEKARDAWEEACDIETASDVDGMREIEYAGEFTCRRPKRSVEWFWTTVWASLMAHLREQSTKEIKS